MLYRYLHPMADLAVFTSSVRYWVERGDFLNLVTVTKSPADGEGDIIMDSSTHAITAKGQLSRRTVKDANLHLFYFPIGYFNTLETLGSYLWLYYTAPIEQVKESLTISKLVCSEYPIQGP